MPGCGRFIGARHTDDTILCVVELGTYNIFWVGEPTPGHNHNKPPTLSLFLYLCFGRERDQKEK